MLGQPIQELYGEKRSDSITADSWLLDIGRFDWAKLQRAQTESQRPSDEMPVVDVPRQDREIKWEKDLVSAYKEAMASGKPLVVLFGTDWCASCGRLQQQVLNSAEFNTLAGRAVFVHADPEKDKEAANMVDSLKITNFPSAVALDAEAHSLKERGRVVGSSSAGEFTRQLATYLPQPVERQSDGKDHPSGSSGEVIRQAEIKDDPKLSSGKGEDIEVDSKQVCSSDFISRFLYKTLADCPSPADSPAERQHWFIEVLRERLFQQFTTGLEHLFSRTS